MANHSRDLNTFLHTLQLEKDARATDLRERPEKEQKRLKLLAFRHAIEIAWVPTLEQYLNVLGNLWFGFQWRIAGPPYQEKPVTLPAYHLAHDIYGPMAIFSLEEKVWREIESPANVAAQKAELMTEEFKQGYRIRIVSESDTEYRCEDDKHALLFNFHNVLQVPESELLKVFTTVYLKGPQVILQRWKNFGVRD